MRLMRRGQWCPIERRPMEVCPVLPSPIAPDECPQCALRFVSRGSLDSHVRLDHVADERDSLTVADILSTAREEPPAAPEATEQRRGAHDRPVLMRAQSFVTHPWVVAGLACVVMLFAVSHVGFGVGRLLLLWILAGVCAAAVALAARGRAQLRVQEDIRRQPPPWR